MKKIIPVLMAIFLSVNLAVVAKTNDITNKFQPKCKEKKEFIQQLDERLNFTPEQKEIIKQNRKKNRKEMEKIVKEMEKLPSVVFLVDSKKEFICTFSETQLSYEGDRTYNLGTIWILSSDAEDAERSSP